MFRQLLILAAVVAVSLANPEEQERFFKECIEELGYNPILLKSDDPMEQENKNKCFSRCVDQKKGFINENDELVLEKINEEKDFDKNRTEKAVEICNDVTKDNECKTAMYRMNCVLMKVYYPKKMEEDKKRHNECRDEVGLKEGEVNKRKSKCVSKCLVEKEGKINKEGKLNSRKILGNISFSIDKEKIDEAVQTCEKTTKAEDDCDLAIKKITCLIDWAMEQIKQSTAS